MLYACESIGVNIRIPYIAATMLSALELYCTLKLEIPP